MNIQLHKNARTTPAIRRELQASSLPTKVLAQEYNLTRATVYKWRKRETTEDASHRPHNIRANLTPAQEAVVVADRKSVV